MSPEDLSTQLQRTRRYLHRAKLALYDAGMEAPTAELGAIIDELEARLQDAMELAR